jgi:hypothetical protein
LSSTRTFGFASAFSPLVSPASSATSGDTSPAGSDAPSGSGSPGRQIATRTMRSPSSSFMAILPLRLMFSKSARLLRRTLPVLVANISCSRPQVL